jgi:hypothetical protein
LQLHWIVQQCDMLHSMIRYVCVMWK